MNWDDVVIGTGNKGSSSTVIFHPKGDPYSVSQNHNSYWGGIKDFDIGITIFKDTEEGKTISLMIGSNVAPHVLDEYLWIIAVKHINPLTLKRRIEDCITQAQNDGIRAAKTELRNWLGVSNY